VNDSTRQHDPDGQRKRSLSKRREEFDEFARQQTERLRTTVEDAIAQPNTTIDDAKTRLDEQLEEATAKQEEASDAATKAERALTGERKILGLATDIAGGAAHNTSAAEDHRKADRLRRWAFALVSVATVWAVVVAVWIWVSQPQGWEWLARPFAGGPVAILLWGAAYAQREAREHRTSARLFEHQSLAFLSLDPYAERIAGTQGDGAQAADFLNKTAAALFTNQIDAYTEQIKTQGRSGRSVLRLLRNSARRDSENGD